MGGNAITTLGDGDETAVIDHVVAAQRDPTRHVTYVGIDPVAVRGDIETAADWRARTLVARDEDGLVRGVVVVDVDEARGRGWWLGPWADDDAEEPSAILRLDLTTWEARPDTAAVRDLDDDDRQPVAALHDLLFPGTHTPGRRLVDDEATSVLVSGEPPLGYVATQAQADGSCYVDYLGVARDARRRGVGRTLVAAALTRAADAGLREACLTVRVGNATARHLYASLGFVEERRAVPHRLGFSLDQPT